jgi:hypothetical protein
LSGDGGNDGDPFARIGRLAQEELQRRGGKADYLELEAWAEGRGMGKYTFRTVIGDMIDDGQILAPDGFLKAAGDMEPAVPKTVALLPMPHSDVVKMKRYLLEHWSVGLIRLFEDMDKAGVRDPNEVVKLLAAQGYVDMPIAGVVNATPKLASEDPPKQASKLSDLVRL